MQTKNLIKYWRNQVSGVAETTANTLEQQADRIAKLEKEAKDWEKATKWMEMVRQVPTKPLSNDEIREIGDECQLKNNGILNWIGFARAIEERHGIK